MLPKRETKWIQSLIVLPLLLALVTLSVATPFCCDMDFNCLNDQRESKGDYEIGANLSDEERNICTEQGRAIGVWLYGQTIIIGGAQAQAISLNIWTGINHNAEEVHFRLKEEIRSLVEGQGAFLKISARFL